MANYERRGDRWRARVMVNRVPDSQTFATKREAVAWATQREAELTGKRLPDHTLAEALAKFAEEKSPGRKGARWEAIRCRKLATYPIAARRLDTIAGPDLAQWRDARLTEVGPASVRREMGLLRAVLRACVKDWGWLRSNPLEGFDKPMAPASRKRRVTADEVRRLELAMGLGEGLAADTAMQRTGLAFLLALETAMRAGEILGLRWPDVREKAVTLPATKNGDVREVPLSKRAREILAALPRDRTTCFDVDPGTRDVLFRRARDATGIKNLHFHDSRAEAIWRLSKKLDVMELARVIGHRDLRSLLLYYNAPADELADRLD
jgi:integrase